MNSWRQKLIDNDVDDDVLAIDEQAFCDSIIGITPDNRIVYDYDKMVEELVSLYGMNPEEAQDHIECNIVRTLLYFGDGAPIIFYPFD